MCCGPLSNAEPTHWGPCFRAEELKNNMKNVVAYFRLIADRKVLKTTGLQVRLWKNKICPLLCSVTWTQSVLSSLVKLFNAALWQWKSAPRDSRMIENTEAIGGNEDEIIFDRDVYTELYMTCAGQQPTEGDCHDGKLDLRMTKFSFSLCSFKKQD